MEEEKNEHDFEYDRVWEVLKMAVEEMKRSEIPDHEMPPAVADFLVYSLISMGKANNVSEEAVETIIERMRRTLEDWRFGNPPFDIGPE